MCPQKDNFLSKLQPPNEIMGVNLFDGASVPRRPVSYVPSSSGSSPENFTHLTTLIVDGRNIFTPSAVERINQPSGASCKVAMSGMGDWKVKPCFGTRYPTRILL